MSEKQLKFEKRAFLAYLEYLLNKQKKRIKEEKGINISNEIGEVNTHLENLDVMIKRKETENAQS